MFATIISRDLTQRPPHSPRDRLNGFVIALRAVDKCRATINGTQGEYHFACPLDQQLFTFKGITAEQFKEAVHNTENYECVGAWLMAHGTHQSLADIKKWSDQMETYSLINDNDPAKRTAFIENCTKLGLDPKKATLFDWLEADDRASFKGNKA